MENTRMEATSVSRSTAARYWAAIGIALLFNPSSPAFAFTPDLHSAFALKAAEAYQSCAGSELPVELGEALAEGTEAEDSSLLTLHQRITHWHFYNRNQTLEPFWIVNRSLDVIFAKRSEALGELLVKPNADPVEVYKQAGRVLHYIQDMSVPGHVVPAYHAKLPGNHSDPFDEFESIEALPVFSLSEAQCQDFRDEVAKTEATPRRFLGDAAIATLRAIEQVDAAGEPIVDGAWKAYWVYPARDSDEARKGWGEYGECEFSKGSGKAGCKRDEDLVALFERQAQQALNSSVLMLFYLEKRLVETHEKTPVQ